MVAVADKHPVLGKIKEWKHANRVWRGDEIRWSFCLGSFDARLDDWFTADELRAIADYIEQHREREPT